MDVLSFITLQNPPRCRILILDSLPSNFRTSSTKGSVMEVLVILLVILSVVFLLAKLMSKAPKQRTKKEDASSILKPKDMVPLAVDHFEKITEDMIGVLETRLTHPNYHAEKALLYAVRVSKIVPEVKTMKTLASRWATACAGSGGYGLLAGSSSPNYSRVLRLLCETYHQRFAELSHEMVLRAIETAQDRKTAKAKQNAVLRAVDRVEKARDEFVSSDLLGLTEQVNHTGLLLNQYANSMIDSSPSKPPDLLRSLAILKTKEIVSVSIVFLDLETTGLDEFAQVVEVAVVDNEGNTLLDTLVKPTEPIPPGATEIHGISNQDVANSPNFAEVWQEQLQPVLTNKTVCIWNTAFDLRIIHQTLFEYELPPHSIQKAYCVMKLYADFNSSWNPVRKQKTWRKLSVAAEQCGIPLPNDLHRALTDAKLTREVFHYIANHAE